MKIGMWKGPGLMNVKQDGMTLIEVIAAIALLSVVILTFAYVFIQSQQVTTDNGSKLTALQLAQKKLSEVLESDRLPDKPSSTMPSPTAVPEDTDYFIKSNDAGQPNEYDTYVYILKAVGTGPVPVVVRTYYDGPKYVELYNYYTTNGN